MVNDVKIQHKRRIALLLKNYCNSNKVDAYVLLLILENLADALELARQERSGQVKDNWMEYIG